jgi:C-terminal processing protease CtpA/Prc
MKSKYLYAMSLLLLALVCAQAALATPPDESNASRIARLAGLCRLWGAIKYFHPDLATKDIDWDAALVKTIPKVSAAKSPEDYRRTVEYLLGFLGDPATRIADEQEPAEAAVNSGSRPQPYVSKTDDNIAVVTATDYSQFSGATKMEEFRKAFAEAGKARCIVFDLRRLAGGDPDNYFFLITFTRTFPALLEKDLQLGSQRHRMYSGYPTQTAGASGDYYSAFVVLDGGIMRASGGEGAARPMWVIINQKTLGLNEVLAGLQSAGLATVVCEGVEGAASADEDFSEGYRLSLPDGLAVDIRTTEFLNPDGSVGFRPDRIVPDDGSDAPLRAALAMVREGAKSEPHASKGVPNSVRKLENPYSDMTNPTLEYRLLALFRFWNVIEYFYPCKHLLDKPWETVLSDMIPDFEAAADAQQYHLTVARLAGRIQDTHGFVGSRVLTEYFGAWRPPLEVKSIQGKTVITHIFTDNGEKPPADIRVGDIVLAVDGEEIGARRERIGQYISHSTPQALTWRVDSNVLGGSKDSPIKLKLQTASGKITEATLTRNSTQRKALREGPVYEVLPSGFGYIDLERLTTAEVDKAFEVVKDMPAVSLGRRLRMSKASLILNM